MPLCILKKSKKIINPFSIVPLFLLLVLLFVILINPYGIKLWSQPFEIYRQLGANKFTTELYNFFQGEYWTLQAKLHCALLLLAGVFLVRRYNSIKNGKEYFTGYYNIYIACTALILLVGFLSLNANRNIVIAQLIIIPFIPSILIVLVKKWKLDRSNVYKQVQKRSSLVITCITVVLYVSIVSNRFYRFIGSPNKFGLHVSMLQNPTGAVDFIRKNRIKGTAFSDYFVSSYMMYSLYPDFRSYIDLRDLDIFPAEFFDEYMELYSQPDKFKELDEKYNFNYVVISTSQLQKLQFKLYWEKGFNLVYVDPVAAIFLKENKANEATNTNREIQRLFTWPAETKEPKLCVALNKVMNPFYNHDSEKESLAPVYAALFYEQLQNYPLAIDMLLPHMNALQDNEYANTTMAKVYNSYAVVTEDAELRKLRLDSAAVFARRVR
jgi:hypothetical protein